MTRQLVVDGAVAEHIRQMFELAAAGKRPQEIADWSNVQGWRTRGEGSALWTARQVLKVISNPTYAGSIRNSNGTLPGQHQPVITQALFEQARDAIALRRSRKPGWRKSKTLWPLRGILVCDRCGRTMSPSVSRHGRIGYCYYRCRSNAGGRPPCRHVCLAKHLIEQYVSSLICSGDWEGVTPDESDGIARLRECWQSMDAWNRGKHLPDIVRAVVFDPEDETVAVTLADDAYERLISRYP